MKNLITNEPVAIVALVEAVLALVVAFGLDLSGEQVATIVAVTTTLLAVVARALVTPVAKLP